MIEPSEEPDFVVHSAAGRLGIELTELHRSSDPGTHPLQAQEAMRRRVLARAKDLYVEAHGPSLHVSVIFYDPPVISKAEVEPLAQQLADIALRNVPSVGQTHLEEFDWQERGVFPEHVQRVAVYNVPLTNGPFFTAPSATWVADLAATDVQSALDSKNPKCAAYRVRCDSVWLLINCNTDFLSTWFEVDPIALQRKFNSDFDRAFLLSHFSGQVFELGLEGNGVA
jgi:hypothetical protein